MPTIVAIIVIIALAIGVTLLIKNPSENTDTTEVTIPKAITGTFTESSSYVTPKKTTFSIDLTLTVSDDIITDASIAYDGKSEGFSTPGQERFDAEYKEEVIGKNIKEVSLSRVGGASLTSKSFNEAVDKMLEKAS
jgi:uncharacterized protein with FMN-binding domain